MQHMQHVHRSVALLAAAFCACSAPQPGAAPVHVQTWGTMREVLRDGRSEGRVALADAKLPGAHGVGVLEGLAGEVTVRDGRVLLAVAAHPDGLTMREAVAGERAALLVLAQVPQWEYVALPDCADYDALEAAIAQVLVQRGAELHVPTPIRVRAIADVCTLHVVDGACPLADPHGPPPRRHTASEESVELIGFFVDGATGVLTHHGRRSHLHAVVALASGHLDSVRVREATLGLPAR